MVENRNESALFFFRNVTGSGRQNYSYLSTLTLWIKKKEKNRSRRINIAVLSFTSEISSQSVFVKLISVFSSVGTVSDQVTC